MRQIIKFIRKNVAQKAPKSVHKQGVYFNVKNDQGYYERVLAYPGENLLDSLQRFHLMESGVCGGDTVDPMTRKEIPYWSSGPSCRACMIQIDNPWYDQLIEKQGEIHYKEVDELTRNLKEVPYGKNNRFACCILVESWMNDMVIRLIDLDNQPQTDIVRRFYRKNFNQEKDLLILVNHQAIFQEHICLRIKVFRGRQQARRNFCIFVQDSILLLIDNFFVSRMFQQLLL